MSAAIVGISALLKVKTETDLGSQQWGAVCVCAAKMAQQVKVLGVRPNNLSSSI